ncbi:MAG: trypsin-like peptidase domain-containing protein [Pirellulales bacterium]
MPSSRLFTFVDSLPVQSTRRRQALLVVWAFGLFICLSAGSLVDASELRRSAIVKAVEQARPSIVNIRGQKVVASTASVGGIDSRRVNGMGTGVVMTEDGYILTNQHVVEGVAKIQVTLDDKSTYIARLVSHDPKTDLAVIKIDAGDKRLPVIRIGTSDDLMPGESVIAVGNAYGYEHTVTRGIISALHRTVQVSDTQNYHDLIQTDASINPGNSGGPLLNIDGDMIGINVAVRVGAQGIGFAIPVDRAMEVAADLLSVKRIQRRWHGVVVRPAADGKGVVVERVEAGSPAEQAGIEAGDVLASLGAERLRHAVDLERLLLDKQTGEEVELTMSRGGQAVAINFVLTSLPKESNTVTDKTWELLGMRLSPLASGEFRQQQGRYRGGLLVDEVRRGSPAARQGIQAGDILVGMHVWETVSLENVAYILGRDDFADFEPVKFYILRDNRTLFGHLPVAVAGTRGSSATSANR